MTGPGRIARKTAVAVVGGTTVVTGVILMPLPGPGTLIAVAGLVILGTEFPAARRLVDTAKAKINEIRGDAASPRETVGSEVGARPDGDSG